MNYFSEDFHSLVMQIYWDWVLHKGKKIEWNTMPIIRDCSMMLTMGGELG